MCWTGLVSSLVATGVVQNSICVCFSLWAPWLWKLPHHSVFSNPLLSHCLLSGTICIDYSISKRLQGDYFVYFAYPCIHIGIWTHMSQKWKVKGKGYYMFLTFSDNSLGKVVAIALNMHTHYEETVAWSFHVLVRYANSYVSYALLSFEVQVVNSHVSLMVSCILRSNPWGFQQEAGQRIGNEAEVNSRARRAKLWKNLSRQSSFNKIGQQGQRCPWSPWLKKRCIRCIQFIRCIGSIFWRHGLLNGLSHRGWNVFALVTTFVLVALHVFMSTSQLALVSNISSNCHTNLKKSQFSMRCTENHQQCLPQLFFKQLSLINCETTPPNASRLSKSIEAIRYKIWICHQKPPEAY